MFIFVRIHLASYGDWRRCESKSNCFLLFVTKNCLIFSHLHRQMQLSMRSQVSLSVDRPAVSPSYVFGGQHVPVIVRLVESLWAQGLAANNVTTGRSLLNGPELLREDQLIRALTLLHVDERCQCMRLSNLQLRAFRWSGEAISTYILLSHAK